MGQFRCMGCMSEYEDTLRTCPECGYMRNTSPSETYCLFPETVLDNRYIVGKALGVGAFAITYLAWDFLNECKVVIKEYFPQAFSSRMPGQLEINTYDGEKAKQFESGLKAFIDEASTLEELSEELEGIVKVERTFIENSTAYTVMEYVEGVTLDKVFAQGKMPWQYVVQLMRPLLPSISLFHEHGMINSNISPDNIIMTRDRQVKLLGFGTSKFATVGSNKNLDVIIKDGYSPVELYRDDVERKEYTDVYSLAAVIYHAITGVVPPSAIDRLSKESLQSPRDMGIDIPESVENSILNALNVDADHRTQNCEQFLTDLISRKPVARIADAKRKRDTSKLSKRAKIIISSLAGVLLCAIVAILVIMSGPTEVEREIVAMPNLSGMTEKQVKRALKDLREQTGYADLDYSIAGSMQMDDQEPGTIIWQDIAPGTEVSDSMEVKIKVAVEGVNDEPSPDGDDDGNSKFAEMPYLTGCIVREAKTRMRKAGFNNFRFVRKQYSNAETGMCYGASVNYKKTVAKNRVIEIYVAKKVKKTKATPSPSPTAKLTPKPTPKPKKTAKPKRTSKPKPKKTPKPKKEMVTVPDLVGVSTNGNDVRDILMNNGLRPGSGEKVYVDNDKKHDTILSHNPPAGAKVKKGTIVNFTVGEYTGDNN